jgi:putative peptide zinc metalloprotease protein
MKEIAIYPRARQDLIWIAQQGRHRNRWTLQDPLAGEFFYFTSNEKDIFDLLNGSRSLQEVLDAIKKQKPGAVWTLEKLAAFVHLLASSNLILVDQYGKGLRLFQQASRQQGNQRWGWLLHPLSIRIPIIKPDRLLKLLSPLANVMFHPAVIALVLGVATFCLSLLLMRWQEVTASIPPLTEMLQGDRILYLALALMIVKSLHELGHAMACYKYAGRCGEIGIMLLVFTPCLYCDVSESWKSSSRWKRCMVALAGIYVEIILATIALAAVLFLPPNFLQALAIYIIGVCTFGTVLLNGNPLVKYDGYFALSDLLGIPNLSDQSREAMWQLFGNWIGRKSPVMQPLDAPVWLLAGYWLLSTLYRTMLLLLILWGVNVLLRPYGLEFLAYYIAAVACGSILLGLVRSVRRFPRVLESLGGLHWLRTMGLVSLAGVLLFFLLAVPFRERVMVRSVVRFEKMEPVFVQQSGVLAEGRFEEGNLNRNDLIAELVSSELDEREARLQTDILVTEEKIRLRKELAVVSSEADLQLPALEKGLLIRQNQLAALLKEKEGLQARTSISGYWFHAPKRKRISSDQRFLSPWLGHPLDAENRGAWLEKGTLLGWVAQRELPFIEAFASENDVARIKEGAACLIRLDSQAEIEMEGEIVTVGTEPLIELPDEIAGDWFLLSYTRDGAKWLPESPTFRVVIRLKNPPKHLSLGSLASVLIEADKTTIYERITRILRQTVLFTRQSQSR